MKAGAAASVPVYCPSNVQIRRPGSGTSAPSPLDPRDPMSDRRTFLKHLAGLGGAALAARFTGVSPLAAAEAADWRDQIGLQLFTVRDRTAQDYPGTLRQVAQIGYKEVQTTGSYGSYTAKQIREFLD